MANLLMPGSLAAYAATQQKPAADDVFQIMKVTAKGIWTDLTMNDGNGHWNNVQMRTASLTPLGDLINAFVKFKKTDKFGTGKEFRWVVHEMEVVTSSGPRQLIEGLQIPKATVASAAQPCNYGTNIQKPLTVTLTIQMAPVDIKKGSGKSIASIFTDDTGSLVMTNWTKQLSIATAWIPGQTYQFTGYNASAVNKNFRHDASTDVNLYFTENTIVKRVSGVTIDPDIITPLNEACLPMFQKDQRNYCPVVESVETVREVDTANGLRSKRELLVRDKSCDQAFKVTLWGQKADHFDASVYLNKPIFLGRFGYNSKYNCLTNVSETSYYFLANTGPAASLKQWAIEIGLIREEADLAPEGPVPKRTKK